uniref:Uncharacterized protein n=1 Tax=Rhipicephalus appendiculatus TaxID=34631 RepID=A0A131YBV5_RHIAP
MLFPPFTTRRPACLPATDNPKRVNRFFFFNNRKKKNSNERSMHTPKHTHTHHNARERKKKKAVKKYGVQYECGKVSLPGKYVQKDHSRVHAHNEMGEA